MFIQGFGTLLGSNGVTLSSFSYSLEKLHQSFFFGAFFFFHLITFGCSGRGGCQAYSTGIAVMISSSEPFALDLHCDWC
jgi:hypothetical protein